MSQETQAWAKEIRTGDPVTKAVLLELCNWARPTGVVDFLSIAALSDVLEISKRTVQRHLARLEVELALIRRVERRREDGGQGANSFELIGYQPSFASAAPPRQSVTPPRQIDMGLRQFGREPRDTAVTRLGDKILPPSVSNETDTPTGVSGGAAPAEDDQIDASTPGGGEHFVPAKPDAARGHRIPDNWTPPPIDDLPPKAKELARQWPRGAYEAEGEAFANFWSGEGGARARKVDWNRAWANWIVSISGKVLRAAKAGVVHASPLARPAQAIEPMSRDGECERSTEIRKRLKKSLGAPTYDGWIRPIAIIVDGRKAIIRCPSAFKANWLQQHHEIPIRRACWDVIGEQFDGVFYESGSK